MNRVGIFGTSGMAREVGDIAHELGLSVTYIAKDAGEAKRSGLAPNIMLEDDLEVGATSDMVFAIGIGDNKVRQRVYERYASRLTFTSLIHPTASFGRAQRDIVAGQPAVIVCAGVRLTNRIEVGTGALMNLNSTVSHDSRIGAFANIAPGANISGNVEVGARAWIGTGAAIIQGTEDAVLRVGEDAVVGAGAVVTRDCDASGVYVGVPAKRIR